jgi:two-component system chemotaxis response regulator CheY
VKTLIVEDDMISRKLLMKFMRQYSEVEVATNGVDALEIFLSAHKNGTPFDLICLDIMMPKLDGKKVLQAIRDYEKEHSILTEESVKVIMTTALNDKKTVLESYDLGCEAYAWKPLDIHKIKEVLVNLGLIESV